MVWWFLSPLTMPQSSNVESGTPPFQTCWMLASPFYTVIQNPKRIYLNLALSCTTFLKRESLRDHKLPAENLHNMTLHVQTAWHTTNDSHMSLSWDFKKHFLWPWGAHIWVFSRNQGADLRLFSVSLHLWNCSCLMFFLIYCFFPTSSNCSIDIQLMLRKRKHILFNSFHLFTVFQ